MTQRESEQCHEIVQGSWQQMRLHPHNLERIAQFLHRPRAFADGRRDPGGQDGCRRGPVERVTFEEFLELREHLRQTIGFIAKEA